MAEIINENSVNTTTENKNEMTTTEEEEQVITEEEEEEEDLSTNNNNQLSTNNNNIEHTTTTTTMSTTNTTNITTTKMTTNDNNILHSVSIDKMDDEKKNLSIKRIIQIIGEGHSKKQMNNNNNNVAENSKVDNDNNNNITTLLIHEFDATTEDPFTLESFDTLIQQHSEKDKDFIIARVTTTDPLDELKSYHSYYSGHHINKVLFRTQPDQGLLHRMKAKNPLNNMNIIGDVHYYVVKATSVKKLPTFAKSSAMSISSKKTLKVKEDDSAIMATSSLDKTEEKAFTKIDIEDIDVASSNGLRSAPPSIWNFGSNDDDDDDDEKFAIEMKSTSNNNNTNNKRWSANDSLKPLPKAFVANHSLNDRNSRNSRNSSNSSDENFEKFSTSLKLQTFNNDDNEDHESSKVVKNNLSSPSENDEISITIPDNNDNSSLKQCDSSIITQSSSKESNDENEGGDGSIYYKAIFYATDDDFLMHSTIRHFFKTNALDPMDAQLFTINASPFNNMNVTPPSTQLDRMVTGHGTYLLDPMVIGNARSPIITRNLESDESNNIPTTRWRRIVNNMKMNKGLRWLVLMYMIFGFLLIRFVVSETYAYLMAFLLMLCLFLVFCVGSGVGIWGR